MFSILAFRFLFVYARKAERRSKVKKILGFWSGSRAYEAAIREKEVEKIIRRKRGMLSDMLNAETASKNLRFWSGLPAYSTLTGKLSEMA
jgi:hypothetical protein